MKLPFPRLNRNISFRQQLGMIFSAGIITLAAVSTIVISELSSQTVHERLVNEALQLTESFAEQSTLALLYQSEEDAAEISKATLAFPDVEWVEILNPDHSKLYSNGSSKPQPLGAGALPDTIQLLAETRSHWQFVAPVYTGRNQTESPFVKEAANPELVGYVRLAMSKGTLAQMESDIFRYNVIVSLSVAGVLLLILLSVTNRVTIPIKNLADTMRQAQAGKKNIRAELRGTKDILEMETAFNTMMDVLEAREKALKTARDQALESARVKGEFAANVSHELRTPMNGVLGMLELLDGMGLSDKQGEYVQVAKNSAESLLSLINDILDFSRNDSGKARLEASGFNLQELFEEIITLLAVQAQRKNLDLAYMVEPSVPHLVIGDKDRLRQVLLNLIGNALKFTERGDVGVTVSLLEEQGDKVTLRMDVTDTGIGIPQNFQNKIFEAFSQVDGSTTRKYGGTGLGLAICRQLVTLMGGDIGLASELGKGSTFWITLPLLKQKVRQPKSLNQIKSQDVRVLVVDDSELVRRCLQHIFEQEQIDCHLAGDTEEAVNALTSAADRNKPFDIVLVDERLHGKQGTDLLRRLRNLPGYKPCYTVMLTNRGETHETTSSNLISAWLVKPIRHQHLYTCINSLLKVLIREPDKVLVTSTHEAKFFKGSRILVVEDNKANQQVAIGMLERLGCSVSIAANGLECLEMVSRNQFDLVLMDCHMPSMDGYETTVQIREWEAEDSRLPIIAMTANIQKGESDKCIAAGMDDYLPKPLVLERLKEKLLAWLPSEYFHTSTQKPEQTVEDLVSSQIDADSTVGVVDQQMIQELQNQIGSVFYQMVEALLEDMPDYLEALQDAVQNAQAKALADIAHTIKGAVSNFGAHYLVELCQKLEKLGRNQQMEMVPPLLARLLDESHRVMDFLVAYYPHAGDERAGDEQTPEKAKQESGRPVQPTILVVDDDRSARFAVVEVLRGEGYLVEEAKNGEDALRYCERRSPDLILMDAIMPKMDGFTACSLLQCMPNTQNTPLLIITALNDESSITQAFSSGATDYISKPINFSVLKKRIARLLQARHAEQHVHQLAYNDTLTGLPNRAMFSEQLNEILSRPYQDNSKVALMFLDLDRFKLVNDTMGHEAGDLLLKYFSERVQGCLRRGDVVARFGGDEFTIILDRVNSYKAVINVAEKIHEQLSRPFVFMSKEIYVSTSIGIAMAPDHGEDIGTLLKNADMAMYQAKEQGKKFQFYEIQMESDINDRMELENDLRGAVTRNEMVLYYQPQQDLATGNIIGMEALIRWQHPQKGFLSPDKFIPMAEETGQILEIGDWVLREASETMLEWRKRGYQSVRMAVNLSARQLNSPGLVERISRILKETGLPPACLELEITESTIMKNPESVILILQRLKNMGLMLAIDDFGTGYSALNYLKRFPINSIKIDRSFINDITSNKVDGDIVKTIIDLAHVLEVKVVAEGVETEAQKALLKNQGCDYAQGYLLSRPVPAQELEERFLIYSDLSSHTG